MNPTPEQQLQRFRLPPPAPDLRARVLAAARQEWNKPAPVSIWQLFRRPLLAIAAALVIAAAGSWTNRRMVSPAVAAAVPAPPPEEIQEQKLVLVDPPPPPPFIHPGAKYAIRKAAMATLGPVQRQSFKILEDHRKPAPGPLTRPVRQNPAPLASC